jgi:hypothetical protein
MAEQAWFFELRIGDLVYALTSLRWKMLCQNKFELHSPEHLYDPQTLRFRC